ncbi:hypothetical protein HYQ44_015099 [Verticillium longisporum]|nr:hypothetical protein HYQ44_015099 [Verticillium longisporum]
MKIRRRLVILGKIDAAGGDARRSELCRKKRGRDRQDHGRGMTRVFAATDLLEGRGVSALTDDDKALYLFAAPQHPTPHVGQFAVFGWIQTAPTLAHSRTAAATLPACHDAVQTREPAAARPHESSSIATPLYRSSCINMASPCIRETLASEEAPDDKTWFFVTPSQPTVSLPSTMPYIVSEYSQNTAKAGPAH